MSSVSSFSDQPPLILHLSTSMAYRKSLILVNKLRNSRVHGGDYRSSTESVGKSVIRRFLQRRSLNATAAGARPPDLLCGGILREKLMLAGITGGNRQLFEGLLPPPPPTFKLTAEGTRRMVPLSMMQQLTTKLRKVKENSISYEEFSRICMKGSGGDDQGSEMAKALNESGHVIIVGNVVFLRPEQVYVIYIYK